MREISLKETDAPPRRRSLRSRASQKNFLRIFYFARARFFLLKGKENFSAWLCSQRAGRRGFASARARRNSPHTPLPPRPRFRRRFFQRAYFIKVALTRFDFIIYEPQISAPINARPIAVPCSDIASSITFFASAGTVIKESIP